MAIRIPTSDQSKIFLGSQEIGAVYVGANKVWPDAPLIDPNAFIMRISVTAGQTVTIPFFNTKGYNGTINWKDGSTSTITSYNDSRRTHTYATAGDYDIEFSGTFKGFYFNNSGDKVIVKRIIQWGNIGMTFTNYAFMGCSNLSDLGDFENYSSVTSIGVNCFSRCTSLTSVTIPSSVTSIGFSCFYNCTSLTSVTIPSSVTSIGDSCFSRCTSLTSVTIPSSVTSIGVSCFYNCTSLTSVTIPSSVTSIGVNCFSSCTSLTSVTIPSSVTSLDNSCFYNCTSLTSVTIPSSVTSLGDYCFYNCTHMLSYYVNPTTPPTSGSSALYGAPGWKIYVPSASVAAYKAAAGWSTYASRIVAQ
jgi:hypothetical protein